MITLQQSTKNDALVHRHTHSGLLGESTAVVITKVLNRKRWKICSTGQNRANYWSFGLSRTMPSVRALPASVSLQCKMDWLNLSFILPEWTDATVIGSEAIHHCIW